jgi:hypothetical protein
VSLGIDVLAERAATVPPVALSSGVYGLAGVAVGGGITWLTQWQLAPRTDRLDVRVAKRRVRAELREHRQRTEFVVDRPQLIDVLSGGLEKHDAWTNYADRLARDLSEADWAAVEQAYDAIANLVLEPTLPDALKNASLPNRLGSA